MMQITSSPLSPEVSSNYADLEPEESQSWGHSFTTNLFINTIKIVMFAATIFFIIRAMQKSAAKVLVPVAVPVPSPGLVMHRPALYPSPATALLPSPKQELAESENPLKAKTTFGKERHARLSPYVPVKLPSNLPIPDAVRAEISISRAITRAMLQDPTLIPVSIAPTAPLAQVDNFNNIVLTPDAHYFSFEEKSYEPVTARFCNSFMNKVKKATVLNKFKFNGHEVTVSIPYYNRNASIIVDVNLIMYVVSEYSPSGDYKLKEEKFFTGLARFPQPIVPKTVLISEFSFEDISFAYKPRS